MALAPVANGTQTATINTEHTLLSTQTSAVYLLHVDTAAMVGGDILELRFRSRVLSGGTDREAYYAVFVHTQTSALKYSIPCPVIHSVSVTLKQTAGTGRAYPWNVLTL